MGLWHLLIIGILHDLALMTELAAIGALHHRGCHGTINVLIDVLLLHNSALLVIIVDGHLRRDVLRFSLFELLIAH